MRESQWDILWEKILHLPNAPKRCEKRQKLRINFVNEEPEWSAQRKEPRSTYNSAWFTSNCADSPPDFCAASRTPPYPRPLWCTRRGSSLHTLLNLRTRRRCISVVSPRVPCARFW